MIFPFNMASLIQVVSNPNNTWQQTCSITQKNVKLVNPKTKDNVQQFVCVLVPVKFNYQSYQ